MFSPIWKLNSPSENRSVLAFPRSQTISAQISLANAGCALPEKILTFPVTLIKRTKRATNFSLLSTLSATRQTKVCRPKRKSGSVLNKAAFRFVKWLGREESNLRMPDPKTGALPLGYAPNLFQKLIGSDLKHFFKCLAVFIPRNCRYGKLSPVGLIAKGFHCCLPCLFFFKYRENATTASAQ